MLTDYGKTVLLLACDGINGSTAMPDYSPRSKTITAVGNAQISTAQSVSGGASALFDGTGDWFQTISDVSDFVFGVGDFTIELWLRTTASNKVLVDFYTTGQPGWQVCLTNSGQFQWYVNSAVKTSVASFNDGAWHHFAITRSGGQLQFWGDGAEDGAPISHTTNLNYQTPVLAIGAQVATRNSAYDYNGYMDNVRIIKGAALYSGAFTPPARLTGAISGVVTDDAGLGCVRQVLAVPRCLPSRVFGTTSDSNGAYTVTVPDVECSRIVLDDDAGTLYNDIIDRVIPG